MLLLNSFQYRVMGATLSKVYIFWEGYKILRNLHRRFDRYYIGQIYGRDFSKNCDLLRIYALYLVFSSGRQSLMWCIRSRLRVLAKNGVPFLVANVGYFLCRKEASSFSWSTIFLLSLMSCCDRFMTPIIPNFTGTTRPHKISIASVPTKKKLEEF